MDYGEPWRIEEMFGGAVRRNGEGAVVALGDKAGLAERLVTLVNLYAGVPTERIEARGWLVSLCAGAVAAGDLVSLCALRDRIDEETGCLTRGDPAVSKLELAKMIGELLAHLADAYQLVGRTAAYDEASREFLRRSQELDEKTERVTRLIVQDFPELTAAPS